MRNLYIVNATQVVTSDSHPEGLFSVMSGYPKTFDSRSYPAADENPNGDEAAAPFHNRHYVDGEVLP